MYCNGYRRCDFKILQCLNHSLPASATLVFRLHALPRISAWAHILVAVVCSIPLDASPTTACRLILVQRRRGSVEFRFSTSEFVPSLCVEGAPES